MKRIIVVRHAKSSWKDHSLQDIERPLNGRGKRDAPKMAKLLFDLGIEPQAFLISPARRTRDTSKQFISQYKHLNPELIIDNGLYHGVPSNYLEALYGLNNSMNCVIMFGHNPGITDIANRCEGPNIDNVPTCGILVIDMNIEDWIDSDWDKSNLKNFYYPKMTTL